MSRSIIETCSANYKSQEMLRKHIFNDKSDKSDNYYNDPNIQGVLFQSIITGRSVILILTETCTSLHINILCDIVRRVKMSTRCYEIRFQSKREIRILSTFRSK